METPRRLNLCSFPIRSGIFTDSIGRLNSFCCNSRGRCFPVLFRTARGLFVVPPGSKMTLIDCGGPGNCGYGCAGLITACHNSGWKAELHQLQANSETLAACLKGPVIDYLINKSGKLNGAQTKKLHRSSWSYPQDAGIQVVLSKSSWCRLTLQGTNDRMHGCFNHGSIA